MAGLELREISLRNYNRTDVKDISLIAERDEVICVVGPAASGKSTLMRIIAGILNSDKGKIILDNVDITNIPTFQRRVALVTPEMSLMPHLNVLDNVIFPLHKQQPNKKKIGLDLLDLVGLRNFASKNINNLSFHQQQNIAILRAIAANPKIMLLDEPFVNLDSNHRHDFIEEALSLIQTSNAYKIFVTSNPQEALLYADKIYFMSRGSIEQIGKPYEIYHTPKNLFVAKFFGQINNFRLPVKGRLIDTPLGKITNNLDNTHQEVNVIIRPNSISLHRLRIAGAVPAEIIVKRFAIEGNFYIARINKYKIKIISKIEVQKGDTVYLKISKYHLMGL